MEPVSTDVNEVQTKTDEISENHTDTNSYHDGADSEEHLHNEIACSSQSDGCLQDERTGIDQSEETFHEERFSNPCKRKRVPSTEYLDAIDKTDEFSSYFQSFSKTEKVQSQNSASFLVTRHDSPKTERSSRVQGPSFIGNGKLNQVSKNDQMLESANNDRLAWGQRSPHSERLDIVQGSVSTERSPWVHQGTSSTELPLQMSNLYSNNGVSETGTKFLSVSSQISSEDNETGEVSCSFSSLNECLPSTADLPVSSSNQTVFKNTGTASSSHQENSPPDSDSCQQTTSSTFNQIVSSSPSISSPRRLFSISTAIASSSSGTSLMSGSSLPEFQGVCFCSKSPPRKEKSLTETSDYNSTFNVNIPSYLLIQIFQHLSMYELLHNVSSVCKLWYNISHDPDLWRVIDLQNQLKVTDVVITNLTSYSDRVIYLNISDITTISEDCLVKTVATCRHLKTLKLSRCISVTTDRLLTAIGKHCHDLHTIHVELCFRITDKGLTALAVGCPKLESVHISQCQNVGDKGLTALAGHCPLLARISVDSCAKIQDEGIMALACGCPEIRVMNLHSCNIGDVGAYQLKRLKFLQTLDLSGSSELSLHTIAAIAQNCTKLECLNLSLKKNIDDTFIEVVARNCTHLKKLYCVSCIITDTGLEFLGKYSRRLEHLDIGWCHSVTDLGVKFVSENCPTLRYVGLIRCDHVTAEGVEELLDKYPHITYSTFILESRKIIEMARMQGFQFPSNDGFIV